VARPSLQTATPSIRLSAEALAPAKVNLFLHVGAPGADGYHPLCSLMVFADIGDRITLFQSEVPDFQVRGPFARGLGRPDENLAARAVQALLAEARRPVPPFGLLLEKRLPVAAGLGGGSSDAATALRLVEDIVGVGVDDERLAELAAALGADVPACLAAAPVIAEGRGERLSPAPDLPELHAVLVNAGPPVSTAEVFRRFDAAGGFGDTDPPPAPDAFEDARELAGWLAARRNDLEAAAIEAEPLVGVVLETLAAEPECLLARVSGSGGTCFALCAGDIEAEGLAERIEALAPDWWVSRCRLGGPWPDPD
jgi:4-diphosphocytidyl-2-C-methyl-D-erythritol kinase